LSSYRLVLMNKDQEQRSVAVGHGLRVSFCHSFATRAMLDEKGT